MKSAVRLVSSSNDLDKVIEQLQLKTYEPIKLRDVDGTQYGSRFRVAKSTDTNYIINWKNSYKENTPLNTNSETIDFLYNVFENNNIKLIESINSNYQLFEFVGRLEDFKLTSDLLGESNVYVKFIVPVVGKKSIAFTNTQIKCNNQIPNLSKNVVNQFIDFDNNYQIDLEKVKYQMTQTQNVLENFSKKNISSDQLIEYYSNIYRVEDITQDKKRIWNDLNQTYSDRDQPNYQGDSLLGAFNTLTYYESNKPAKQSDYSRFLKNDQASRIRVAYNLGRQIINM